MSSESIQNLWGELPKPDLLVAPVNILRHQAGLLSDMTRGMLVGEIRKNANSAKGIAHSFRIRVPAMGNYNVTLCRIDHSPFLYPVFLYDVLSTKVEECSNQMEFEEKLGILLSSQETLNLIQGLLSSAQASIPSE